MRILDRWREWLKRHPWLAGAVAWLGRRRRRLTALFVVLAHVIGALTSVRAIMEVRTSQGAIAWAISLNTMPYVAVPAYWVFGRSDFKGYVTARRSHHAEVKEFWDEFHQTLIDRDLLYEPERAGPFVNEQLAKLSALCLPFAGLP